MLMDAILIFDQVKRQIRRCLADLSSEQSEADADGTPPNRSAAGTMEAPAMVDPLPWNADAKDLPDVQSNRSQDEFGAVTTAREHIAGMCSNW